jgi:hypothetical protein
LLKLEVIDDEAKYPEYKDTGDLDMDEEDHEAVCSMFATIGKTIDQPHAAKFMRVCFTKIAMLSNHKSLAARPRFMYKDLLELRDNRWEARREQVMAKTIEEIRKDFEREERRQAQQSQQMGGYRGGRGGGGGGGGGGDRRDYGSRDGRERHGDHRGDSSRRDLGGSLRASRQPKPPTQTDDDGFTVIGRGSARAAPAVAPTRIATKPTPSKQQQTVVTPSPTAKPVLKPEQVDKKEQVDTSKPPPLTLEKLKSRINTMRNEFIQDSSNVEELMLTFDELAGTPDAVMTLVSMNADRIFDCKDEEREAISAIFTLLFEKGKLTKDDIRNGLAEIVEFIDSFILDSPRAYDYLVDLLSAMLKVKALDVAWLCEQCEKLKLDPNPSGLPEKVVRKTMEATKQKFGVNVMKSCFGGKDDGIRLARLLGDEKWNAIASEMLS